MSTVSMLSVENRLDEVAHFVEWQAENGNPVTKGIQRVIKNAAGETIYGHIIGSNLEHFRGREIDPVLALRASLLLCDTTVHSADMLTRDTEHVRSSGDYSLYADSEFWSALERTQEQIAAGNFKEEAWLPPRYRTSRNEGLSQVKYADGRLGVVEPKLGELLAGNNYSLYWLGAMASGAEIPKTSINDIIEGDDRSKLVHLTRVNYAIGQILQAASARRHDGSHLDVVEVGPGTAATSAAVLGGLNESGNTENISFLGFEPNEDFMKILESFVSNVVAEELGGSVIPEYRQQNAVEGFKDLSHVHGGKHDVAAYIAGYAMHRIPTEYKRQMIRQAAASAYNVIFLVGDLLGNGSPINSGILNWSQNGPLNAGNSTLVELFQKEGFNVEQLTRHNAPDTVNPSLVEALEKDVANDGHMWVATLGEEAERLVA